MWRVSHRLSYGSRPRRHRINFTVVVQRSGNGCDSKLWSIILCDIYHVTICMCIYRDCHDATTRSYCARSSSRPHNNSWSAKTPAIGFQTGARSDALSHDPKSRHHAEQRLGGRALHHHHSLSQALHQRRSRLCALAVAPGGAFVADRRPTTCVLSRLSRWPGGGGGRREEHLQPQYSSRRTWCPRKPRLSEMAQRASAIRARRIRRPRFFSSSRIAFSARFSSLHPL